MKMKFFMEVKRRKRKVVWFGVKFVDDFLDGLFEGVDNVLVFVCLQDTHIDSLIQLAGTYKYNLFLMKHH